MVVCEFCRKEISTKTNLKIHQTRTKRCLEIQKKSNPIIEILCELCKYCGKKYQHKQKRELHETTCITHEIVVSERETLKTYYETIINNMKLQHEKEKTEIYSSLLKKEQDFLHEQTKMSKTNITTTNIKSKYVTMNALNLSQERLHSIKDTYTINHYERGGVGQADWVIENVLKDENGNIIYKCTDKNRKNFIYQDDKGNIITDIHAKKLKEAILPVIEKKLKEYKKIKYSELAEVDDDESELLEKCNELYKENRELGNEFDKRLVEKTY